jgi:heat shock protein HtpX
MKSDLYSQIDSNKRKTTFIMVGFVFFITALIYALGYLWLGQQGVIALLPLALIFSVSTSVFSYYNSARIVLATSGAKVANKENFLELNNLVENLAIVAGVPKPKVYYINDSAPNAFATGRDYNNSVICVTTGLLDKLNKQELEGVLAHEFAHIKNYDIRLFAVVAVLIGFVVLLADWALRSSFFRDRDGNKSGGVGLLFVILLSALAPLALELIKLAISRNREYLADATGAYFTRYPKGLAEALVKISGDNEKLESANRGTAHMYISDPFKRKAAALFSTHPPVKDRIKRLREM